MLSNIKIGKIGVFIDEANVYHSQKTLGWQVDFIRLVKYLKQFGEVALLKFYTSYIEENRKQEERFVSLALAGYSICKKKLKFIRDKTGKIVKKGNLDIELALDAYRNKDSYSTIFLFSGDSDFAYLLDLLKAEGKLIYVFSTKEHISRDLINVADEYIDLRKTWNQIHKS